MKLINFEKNIEDKILSRGLSYFKNEWIQDIEEVEKNEYVGTALGTDEYNVLIKLDSKGNVIRHLCDCPYDCGDICKHEVALLFFLKDSIKKEIKIQTGKVQIIKKELESFNKKELIETMLELSKCNKSIRQQMYWELGFE